MKKIEVYKGNEKLLEGKSSKSTLFKLKGLMFRKKLKENQCIMFEFNKEEMIMIHMLFVFFNIDAVWLDKNYKILEIKRNIKPFTYLIKPKFKAKYLIETLGNKTDKLSIGDNITVKFK